LLQQPQSIRAEPGLRDAARPPAPNADHGAAHAAAAAVPAQDRTAVPAPPPAARRHQLPRPAAAALLGEVVERISGTSLAAVAESRIFRPLSMADTHFGLPEALWPRLVRWPTR
jgi:CubicO group peptidase (beta-lactamase class C family)